MVQLRRGRRPNASGAAQELGKSRVFGAQLSRGSMEEASSLHKVSPHFSFPRLIEVPGDGAGLHVLDYYSKQFRKGKVGGATKTQCKTKGNLKVCGFEDL